MSVLISGGAGFIGVNLARRLIKEGYTVKILDNFSRQIHGENTRLPADLEGVVQLIVADVADKATFHDALSNNVKTVVHLAAETGTGQSMYEIEKYERTNIHGTANLVDFLVNDKRCVIKKIVVASSRAIYGEGKYHCQIHGSVFPTRNRLDLQSGMFEPKCPICASHVTVLPTDEDAKLSPQSFYGLTKQIQEQMLLMFGGTKKIDVAALRYQNVYGPGQSLVNPYTGILAVFSNLARAGAPINIFEDGMESRDFVYIDDVVAATCLCISDRYSGVDAFNVGFGKSTTVMEVAKLVVEYYASNSVITVTGDFRDGDIRHNYADLTKINNSLGFVPKTIFKLGLTNFLDWAGGYANQGDAAYNNSLNEMADKGLFYKSNK